MLCVRGVGTHPQTRPRVLANDRGGDDNLERPAHGGPVLIAELTRSRTSGWHGYSYPRRRRPPWLPDSNRCRYPDNRAVRPANNRRRAAPRGGGAGAAAGGWW